MRKPKRIKEYIKPKEYILYPTNGHYVGIDYIQLVPNVMTKCVDMKFYYTQTIKKGKMGFVLTKEESLHLNYQYKRLSSYL